MLDEEENKIFRTKMKRSGYHDVDIKRIEKELSVSYWNQDNFVTAVITHDKLGVVSIGVVKRNPIDPFNEGIGIKYSFVRAIDNYEYIYNHEF